MIVMKLQYMEELLQHIQNPNYKYMDYRNKLIKDWTKKQREDLATEVSEFVDYYYNKKYTILDIQAAGSRVFGGFKNHSDLDVVVRVKEKDVRDNCSIFYKDIRVSVRIETQPKDGSLWRKCYVGSPHKPEGRNLPTFSLLNHKVFGSDSDVEWHKNFRKQKDNKIK